LLKSAKSMGSVGSRYGGYACVLRESDNQIWNHSSLWCSFHLCSLNFS
jgi:hypothetical protein